MINDNDFDNNKYIALELVKLDNHIVGNRENIYDVINDYNECYKFLVGIDSFDKTVNELEEENNNLKKLIKDMEDNKQDEFNEDIILSRLKDIIVDSKGDMEPYVYTLLLREIDSKINK